MGVRTRGLDIKAGAAKLKADPAARAEAEAVIQRWNDQLSRVVVTSCGRQRSALRCALECPGSMCSVRAAGQAGWVPMLKLLGLYALPPATAARARC
jgi:hypothetical protein